jgi:hypothetical protein
MTASLLSAELRTVEDVAELDTSEAAELFGELRAAAVPLGDRSRLRKATWGSGCSVARLHGGVFSTESTEERRAIEVTEHRQLQTSGGFSIEVAAIVFTGLIGMIGYVVQARSAQRASEAQTSLEREAAEREKVVAKAEKQLQRVHVQLADFAYPVQALTGHFCRAFDFAESRCGLEDSASTYCNEFHSPPTQPHVSVLNIGNPKSLKAFAANPFKFTLAPEDLARLAADPAKRARWIELVTHGMLPPLRELVSITQTKVRPASSGSTLPASPS